MTKIMQHDQKHAHERITGFGVCGKRNKELDQHPILCLTDLSLSQGINNIYFVSDYKDFPIVLLLMSVNATPFRANKKLITPLKGIVFELKCSVFVSYNNLYTTKSIIILMER